MLPVEIFRSLEIANWSARGTQSWSSQIGVTAIALTLIISSGCASTEVPPIPEFASMAIQAKQPSADSLPLKPGTESSDKAYNAGTKGGAVAGAASSLACGPLVLVCLPAGILAGAMYGGYAGAAVDASREALSGFPPETAQEFAQKLRGIESRRDFFIELRDSVSRAIPGSRQVSVDDAQAVFHVGPDAVVLVKGRESSLSLRMTASLFAEWDRDKGWPSVAHRWYSYTTSEMPIEEWVNNEGEAIEVAFTECITELAAMIVDDVATADRQTTSAPGSL